MMTRDQLPATRRWVIKIGSALLTSDGQGLNREILAPWLDQMTALRHDGADLVLVSSGAVAEGMARMGWKRRPQTLHELQAAAAIGQMGLIRAYEDGFGSDQRGAGRVELAQAGDHVFQLGVLARKRAEARRIGMDGRFGQQQPDLLVAFSQCVELAADAGSHRFLSGRAAGRRGKAAPPRAAGRGRPAGRLGAGRRWARAAACW